MADKDKKPLFLFDFGARETEETLRTRLLLEAEVCMVQHDRPMRQLLDELRGYMVKSKGFDSHLYPILRILSRYLDLRATNFEDLVSLLGWDKALEFTPGARPPSNVFFTLSKLQQESNAEYAAEFWNKILDAIERGEENRGWYLGVCNDYLYNRRNLRPGYDRV